ncbi:MAG TPA: DUF4302 domain-containing protein, partial [Chitinophagaceae bacterium]|nr:DUF4302 domain-containing protein [Chitinophagaceae bacterium]
MKKIAILYFIVASVVVGSCKKDKTVFSETADERLNKVLTAYQDTLINAPYGWKGFIFPSGQPNGVFGFYFKFKAANRVEMFSDFDSLSNVTVMESSWRLKALQQPALIFDTYSYVTVLADPDASVNGGEYGSGLSSDFEFAIDSVKADTIKLTGRKNSSKAWLVKATKQDMDDYYNKKHTNRLFNNISKYLTYFKRITVGATTYEIVPNPQSKTVTITWVDGSGVAHTVTTGYYYTTTGIGFVPPVTNGSTTISGFDNISWDAVNSLLTVTVNGTAMIIAPAATPIAPDPAVSTRWYQYALGQGGYWITATGFHVNGVDDAFNITKIA